LPLAVISTLRLPRCTVATWYSAAVSDSEAQLSEAILILPSTRVITIVFNTLILFTSLHN
jgi:hypothetical protein